MNISLIALLLFGCSVLSAQNLLKNSDFNAPEYRDEIFVLQNAGKVKVSIETENLTWNKCLRMEIANFKEANSRKNLSCMVKFGKNGNKNQYAGFAVEPDTVYDFSFELKGNRGVALWATFYNTPSPAWRGKNIRLTPPGAAGEKNNWTKVKGSFRTGKDTKFASLNVQFWADSKHMKKMPQIGDYALIDNVVITKRKSITSAAQFSKITEEKPRSALLVPSEGQLTLTLHKKTNEKLNIPYETACDSKNIKLSFTLPAEAKGISKAAENNKNLWQDDVVEIFFAPFSNDRAYTQFVLASGGGRFYRAGDAKNMFNQWQAKCKKISDGRRIFTFVIPWKLLGTDIKPADGSSIGFNLGVQNNKKSYTFESIKVGFNDVQNFGNIIFGSAESYRKNMAEKLTDVPKSLTAEVKKFTVSKNTDPAEAIAEYITLCKKINSAKLGSAAFLLAKLNLRSDFSHPLEITPEQLINSTIKLSGARNEIIYLPLAIANRTDKTTPYRVVVHADKKNFNSAEKTGLSNNFPAKNIVFREALLIKDNDGKNPDMLFDPLPEMNQARTITIPANSTAPVWLEFDCSGVTAGKYTGSVRITPLNRSASFRRYNYKGPMQDYPLELEVIDITLPDPLPLTMFQRAVSQDFVNKSLRLGNPMLMISSWSFPFKFDSKGNLIKKDVPHAVRTIKQYKSFYKNMPRKVKPRYMIGYSFYETFKRAVKPKSIKVMTPEWENCWKNYIQAVEDVFIQCGVAPSDIVYELADEPRIKYENEYLTMTRIARKAVPEGKLLMTWGPLNFGYTADKIKPYESILNEHGYHWLLLNDPEIMKHVKKMQQSGINTSLYECSTNIRENLHTYFRLHPWRAYLNGFTELGFYTYIQDSWGQPGATDWKTSPRGGLVYRVDDVCIPSIRMFALQQGVDDIRYMRLLKKYSDKPEVAGFIKEIKGKILKFSHNSELPAEFRRKARLLLKKYHK